MSKEINEHDKVKVRNTKHEGVVIEKDKNNKKGEYTVLFENFYNKKDKKNFLIINFNKKELIVIGTIMIGLILGISFFKIF